MFYMKYGIITTTIVPLRTDASERSEMSTQIQFGELFYILDTRKNWFHIKTLFDDYEGWIDVKTGKMLEESDFFELKDSAPVYTSSLVTEIFQEDSEYPIKLFPGSEIRSLKSGTFNIRDIKYSIKNGVRPLKGNHKKLLVDLAMMYINAPYIWGGKSPFGVDCSGLTQIVYKVIGIPIPRDAKDQVKMGTTLNFVNETEPGDLVFFDNDEGDIIHVGMIIEPGKIIHASGHVKINKLDHQGIYNDDLKKYTHKLRVIQRIL